MMESTEIPSLIDELKLQAISVKDEPTAELDSTDLEEQNAKAEILEIRSSISSDEGEKATQQLPTIPDLVDGKQIKEEPVADDDQDNYVDGVGIGDGGGICGDGGDGSCSKKEDNDDEAEVDDEANAGADADHINDEVQQNDKAPSESGDGVEENQLVNRAAEDSETVENDTASQVETAVAASEEDKEESKVEPEEEEVKQPEFLIPKLNGNHSLSIHDDDEESCSSTTSSASSHNLVIDHPLAEESPRRKLSLSAPVLEDNGEAVSLQPLQSLKRKHSGTEIDSATFKQIHLDLEDESVQMASQLKREMAVDRVEETPMVCEESRVEEEKEKKISAVGVSISAPSPVDEPSVQPPSSTPGPSPFAAYTKSSLPEPRLSFDCFKCKNATFDTFTELREHHKVCLFRDSHRKLPATPTITPACHSATKENTMPAPPVEPPDPPPPTEPQPKKRFYLCSSCGTYHENWNLFLHIREIHNRHVCLYCIRLFPTAEKLSLHLEIKHDLEQNHFNSEERLRSVSKSDGNSRFLMCCTCQHVFSEHERFSDHVCMEYIQPCSLCNQKGRHSLTCKANPEKRAKVKKKPKPASTITKAIAQLNRTAPSSTYPTVTATVSDIKNSSSQMVMSTMPMSLQSALPTSHFSQEFLKQNGFTEPSPIEVAQQKHTEEYNCPSDDSTNMVIDETCNTNTYVNEMAPVNPFKALDERERLLEEVQKAGETKTILPPDRVPETIPEPKPLIVPKIKLRVPKEFQKAVESEISSSDSDEDDDEEGEDEPEDEEEVEKERSVDAPFENNVNATNVDSDDNDVCSNEEKAGSPREWDEPNSNLERLLKEIEKTKLDIQRTKEMHKKPPFQALLEARRSPSPNTVPLALPSEVEPIPMNSQGEPVNSVVRSEVEHPVWKTPEQGMYSPTPQATPNSVWASPLYLSEVSPAILQAVSERENIENMEKESEQAKEQTSDSDKMDTSGEMDVDMDPMLNQEEEGHTAAITNSSTEFHVGVENRLPTMSPSDFIPIGEGEEKSSTVAPEEPPPPPQPEVVEKVVEKVAPADGIEVATDDVPVVDLLLDRPIEKFNVVEFVRLCVTAVYSLCLYCNHARRIAVNGHSLVLHLLAQHRFTATVDSITAEELLPSTIVSKLKSFLPDLEEQYFNLKTYCSIPPKEGNVIDCDERVFECFQCRFSTKMHKDLYLHNRKMHLKTAILCFMCRANFFSFSEILCHICPGMPNKVTVFDIKFRCCLCDVDGIPSPFRLMVHLRKKHFACDICLEDCREQGRLSSHVWKHKLHHLCYRCGIAYRNKMDITKHLFWKHGTESIICKRCLQKRWRHVYHFCVPPATFVCDMCQLCFSKATYLKVHKRVHSGDFRYPCMEDNCEEKFISRKLLLKHSATHAPPEIKVEEKPHPELETVGPPELEDHGKDEESVDEKKPPPDLGTEKENADKEEEKKVDKDLEQVSKRKKKKNRNKESLEDLNLIAPNLSESDSSDESDTEKPKTEDKESLVPNVMLSPPSEEEKDEEKDSGKQVDRDAGKIMDIWENFKSFQASQQPKQDEDENEVYSESNYPTPILHVAISDHDYCAMYKIRARPPVEERKPVILAEPEPAGNTSDQETEKINAPLREKSSSPNKKKRKSTGSGSSSSDSSSGSDSSCSCGSNCSCSSSGSSSSSSSSDDDSDSSTSAGRRRIAEKKQERADRNRWKSESSLKASLSETVDVVVEDKEPVPVVPVKENLEPVLMETDLETAESATDEEFYDEHPQKLASEMLAQKRLQLRAQMRLSPSHNFDIMENSRPSTPSLPEEVVKEKKVKLKKKKRDRKLTSKSQAVPPIKLNLSVNKVEISSKEPIVHHTPSMQVPAVDLLPPYELIASPGVAEPPVAQQPPPAPTVQNNTVKPVPFFRMSEGSSCSDADNSLKRSKRARRPNKFYGYTSDDENTPGTPLMIGTRTFKPQPPPQLTWRKEDLPAPSKSILLNKQPRSPRTPKIPAVGGGPGKKRVHQKPNTKKKPHRLPPIPTLKIRPSKIGLPMQAIAFPPPPPPVTNQVYSPLGQKDSDDSDSSDDDLEIPAANTLAASAVLGPIPEKTIAPPPHIEPVLLPTPPPQPPQASAFNQKIPPALLPNPDFATIQYFKRNNIRYPIRPPAGARQPRDGESVYCYCRCPYDEVSEMIACDGENCLIEWFHFECVGIMVAPQGKWFCAECRPKYSNELYPKL